ncbi:hypothetical protein LguiA_032102 [Lonicera macranthoides]
MPESLLSLDPRRLFDPSNGAAIRRASIVWFRNDLRIQDNECLNSANYESMSILQVYCFDPRDYGKSSKNLQARGSELVVRIGKPESVFVELVNMIRVEATYARREVSRDEVKAAL